jgi:hypothetical protein
MDQTAGGFAARWARARGFYAQGLTSGFARREFETPRGGAEAHWRHGQALDARQRLLERLDRRAGLPASDDVD